MALKGLEALAAMEYPGRIIIIGRGPRGHHDVVIYAITGRSSSSQARRLICDGQETVRSQGTDPERIKEGNERLLIYNCIRKSPDGLAVSNGAQTDLILETIAGLRDRGLRFAPVEILQRAFARPHVIAGIDLSGYEPDAPAFTPRISGCVMNGAALSMVKRAPDGTVEREYFEVPLSEGEGKLITTYAGANVDPLPSFCGEPVSVQLEGQSAEEQARAVYNCLAPRNSQKDFRVAVAVIFSNLRTSNWQMSIINKYPGEG
jgi:IMP cyclohydrolase